MKQDPKITEAFSPVAGTDLSSLRVECVFCDETGEPVKRRTVAMLSLLGARRRARSRQLFADSRA